MNKIIFFLLLAVAYGFRPEEKKISERELVGIWKADSAVVMLETIPEKEKKTFEVLRGAFATSTFTFQADKAFSMDIEIQDFQIRNNHWKYNPASGTVTIQEWKDRETDKAVIAEFVVLNKDGKIFFAFYDLFIAVEVHKITAPK